MASRFPQENQAQLRPRKGHDMKWSCDKHAEPIAFYCKKHDISICHRCATKVHGQKPCELDDIEDVILDRMRKVDDKRHEIEKTKKQLKTLNSKIEFIATFTSNHLQTVNDEVKSTHQDKSRNVKEKEETKIRLINEEADEEIRIINEKRDGRIKACNAEIENRQLISNGSQARLISETKAISEVVSKKINDLTSKNQHAISTLDNIDAKIERIKQDDKTLVNEASQVIASLDDNLSLIVHQDVSDCLEQIQREVQKVKFFEGEVGGEHYGRIDGYIGRWELIKAINIANVRAARRSISVNAPALRGLISDDEVCVRDVGNDDTYITNISTEHTQKVIVGQRGIYITSCASVLSNVVVCGNGRCFTDDSLDGCITLYDRQWEVIRDIRLPMKIDHPPRVYIDVDRDGMILATQYDQSKIFVIKPDYIYGKILENNIMIQGKVVRGEIQSLLSGDVVVKTDDNAFTVISRSGEEKAVIHSDEWSVSYCSVNKLTDTLYITYWDDERNIHAVDQVSCDGIIQARRIVEYVGSDRRSTLMSQCLVTPTGNLVACDGAKLFVYKKRFIV